MGAIGTLTNHIFDAILNFSFLLWNPILVKDPLLSSTKKVLRVLKTFLLTRISILRDLARENLKLVLPSGTKILQGFSNGQMSQDFVQFPHTDLTLSVRHYHSRHELQTNQNLYIAEVI